MDRKYVKVGRRHRMFWEAKPSVLSEKTNLLFLLHGFGQSAQRFAALTGLNDFMEFSSTIVVYPVGDFRSWWTVCKHRDIDHIFLRAIYRRYTAEMDLGGYFVIGGLSDGAYFANAFANLHSDWISGVISVAGGMVGREFQTRYKYPALVVQGKKDFLNKPDVSKKLVYDYNLAGHPTDYLEHERGHVWPKELNPQITDWLRKL